MTYGGTGAIAGMVGALAAYLLKNWGLTLKLEQAAEGVVPAKHTGNHKQGQVGGA